MRIGRAIPDVETEDLLIAERVIVPCSSDVRQRILATARNAPVLIPRAIENAGRSRRPALRLGLATLVVVSIASVAAAALQIWPKLPRASNDLSAKQRPASVSLPSGLHSQTKNVRSAALATTSVDSTKDTAKDTATDTDGYAREMQVLERARRAFARGDYDTVFSAIDEHQRTFPSGRLAEERDALRVRVLFRQHRFRDARRAAEAFRDTFPHSIFLRGL
jgi:hypothetical protein